MTTVPLFSITLTEAFELRVNHNNLGGFTITTMTSGEQNAMITYTSTGSVANGPTNVGCCIGIGSQSNLNVASLSNNYVVVVFQGDHISDNVFVGRWEQTSLTSPISSDNRANPVQGSTTKPSVAAFRDGRSFVVTYLGENGAKVVSRRYFERESWVSNLEPGLTHAAGKTCITSQLVVTAFKTTDGTSSIKIKMTRHDDGSVTSITPITGEIVINAISVTATPSGGFILAYQLTSGLEFRLYSVDGVMLAAETSPVAPGAISWSRIEMETDLNSNYFFVAYNVGNNVHVECHDINSLIYERSIVNEIATGTPDKVMISCHGQFLTFAMLDFSDIKAQTFYISTGSPVTMLTFLHSTMQYFSLSCEHSVCAIARFEFDGSQIDISEYDVTTWMSIGTDVISPATAANLMIHRSDTINYVYYTKNIGGDQLYSYLSTSDTVTGWQQPGGVNQFSLTATPYVVGKVFITYTSTIQDGYGSSVFMYVDDAPFAAQMTLSPPTTLTPLTPVPDSIGLHVNTVTRFDQKLPRIADLGDGGFVIVWESRLITSGSSIVAQLYLSDGTTSGGEITLALSGGSEKYEYPDVAPHKDGGFVLCYQSYRRQGTQILVQVFDPSASPVSAVLTANPSITHPYDSVPRVSSSLTTGEYTVVWHSFTTTYNIYRSTFSSSHVLTTTEEMVNSYTTSQQYHPDIAYLYMLEPGTSEGFVITWQSEGEDGSHGGIYASFEGGAPFPVNTETDKAQRSPSIAAHTRGGFVIVWHSFALGSEGIFFQQYNADGTVKGSETQVHTSASTKAVRASVATLAAGSFAVTWTSEYAALDDHGMGIFIQKFNADGTMSGSEELVNTYTSFDQRRSCISRFNLNGFVIAWQGDKEDGSGLGIITNIIQPTAQPIDEFLVNVGHQSSTQRNPHVAAIASGFVVVWESYGQDGDGWGVYYQEYTNDAFPVGTAVSIPDTTTGDQTDPRVASVGDYGFLIIWQSGGESYLAHFKPNGVKVGELQVYSAGVSPDVVGWADGTFAVVAVEDGQLRLRVKKGFVDGASLQMTTFCDAIVADFIKQPRIAGWDTKTTTAYVVSYVHTNNDAGTVYVTGCDDSNVNQGTIVISTEGSNPDITTLGTDGFAVGFEKRNLLTPATSYFQRGIKGISLVGVGVKVNSGGMGDSGITVVGYSDSSVLASYHHLGVDGPSSSVGSKKYDSSDLVVDSSEQLNEYKVRGSQFGASSALIRGGSTIITVWTSDGIDSDGYGIAAKIYSDYEGT
eukprot:TRINITY_DN614_c0_g1_i4.p1 TRINITY_DN614_c0_g1~~TRINITY_DN614_c0_g1_i4.p1  ORF type:complete len:1255 (+),score=214.14 TRINITY_DN614_c0_g1_i4:520-4284(+)